jgi:hypothetical protein
MVEKFDYIILNDDNEWLSSGTQETQDQFEQELEMVKSREFDRWGEKTEIIVYKAPSMTKEIIF